MLCMAKANRKDLTITLKDSSNTVLKSMECLNTKEMYMRVHSKMICFKEKESY
jgi:2-hydroxy-3-keto-5-methylthiopentenyl-1-phosphate phosphatase